MTEIMPFPENNCKTVLLDRPERWCFLFFRIWEHKTENHIKYSNFILDSAAIMCYTYHV